jgi:hypothetical protein
MGRLFLRHVSSRLVQGGYSDSSKRATLFLQAAQRPVERRYFGLTIDVWYQKVYFMGRPTCGVSFYVSK